MWCRIAFLFLFVSLGSVQPLCAQSDKKVIRFTEKTLRERATKVVMPAFPEEAVKRKGSGLAIAELEIDVKGDVTLVQVLKSPDEAITEALQEAIKRWKFRPARMADEPVCIRGELSFRYDTDGKKRSVKNAK